MTLNTIGRRMAAGFGSALVLLALMASSSYSKVGTVNQNQKWVVHTYEVLEGLTAIMSTLKDAETGQRGYLITGELSYLQPYTDAKNRISDVIDVVAKLTSDNAEQQDRITTLRSLVDDKFTEMQQTVDLRGSSGFTAAQTVVLQNKGKAVMDEIRQVLATMDDAERSLLGGRTRASDEATSGLRTVVLLGLVIGLLLLTAIGVLLTRSIVRPVSRVREALRGLAKGDLTVEAKVNSADEVGQMAADLTRAQSVLREAMTGIATASTSLDASAGELSTVSTQVSNNATRTAERSVEAASAAEEVSQSVQTVAAATEQMSASIGEIASNSAAAAKVAEAATTEAAAAQGAIGKLGSASREIGDFLKVITSIAEQTNLLALNATIEAARAGDAGKGFAVVASEVKDLAQETGRAAEDISNRIAAIQTSTDGAVAAIERISKIVDDINKYQVIIASAVEEQTATTGEIARSVSQAATGSSSIAENVATVARAAEATTGDAAATERATHNLTRTSSELRQLVDRYTF
jgi:methyl-accepting chemotaxis protein